MKCPKCVAAGTYCKHYIQQEAIEPKKPGKTLNAYLDEPRLSTLKAYERFYSWLLGEYERTVSWPLSRKTVRGKTVKGWKPNLSQSLIARKRAAKVGLLLADVRYELRGKE